MRQLERRVIDSYKGPWATGGQADCPKCILEIKASRAASKYTRGVPATVGDWRIVGCEDCQGTLRDLIPWTELYSGNRYFSRTFGAPRAK